MFAIMSIDLHELQLMAAATVLLQCYLFDELQKKIWFMERPVLTVYASLSSVDLCIKHKDFT